MGQHRSGMSFTGKSCFLMRTGDHHGMRKVFITNLFGSGNNLDYTLRYGLFHPDRGTVQNAAVALSNRSRAGRRGARHSQWSSATVKSDGQLKNTGALPRTEHEEV